VTPLGPALPDLSVRDRQAELMDDPELDPARHVHALRALARVNRVSLTVSRIWTEVLELRERVDGPIRILDVACGGGDVLSALGARARRTGIPVELRGCDVSRRAVDEAARAAPDGVPLEVAKLDALEDDLPSACHLVVCSLFLHHLDRSDAVRLLCRMAAATEVSLLVEDLRRTRLGYLFAWIGLHTLTRSDVARTDGLRSVRSAFSVEEVRALCAEAGLERARLERVWPQRFSLVWRRAA